MSLTLVSCALLASQSFAAIVRSDTQMLVEANGKVKEFNVNTADTDTAVDTAQTVLAEVENWARSGSPPEGKNIKTIDELAQKLEEALYATHKDAQDQVNENIAQIEKCNTDQESSMEHIRKTTKVKVGERRDEHAKCRNEEVVIFKDMEKKCKHLTTWLKTTVEDTPKPDGSTDDEMVDYVEKMSGYWCGKGKVAEEKQKVCEDRKQDHRDKKEGCDKFQSQFESGFCVWRTEMIDVCNAQETCYDAARNAYDAHVKSTQMLVQKWKIEYTALKKIICYVNVWFDKDNHATVAGGEDTDVDREKLETCKNLKPDQTKMDINFGDAPEQKECSLADVKVHPGTEAFKTTEYSAWLEFANEPSSCLEDAEPTKAPAPAPVDNMELVGNGCCRFDGWKASNKGYRSVDACKKLCTEDAACIAADTARPDGKYRCFLFYGTGKNFKLQCGTSNSEEKCFRKTAGGY